jgi:hypothetical protein
MSNHANAGATHHSSGHYARFLVMTLLSFVAKYFLMYAMINRADNF